MAENTKIEWCDMTWNPWRGCARVSAGCINCYAERQAKRNPAVLGEWRAGKRVIASESYWQQPLKWNRKAEKEGRRYRVFCGSMMDVFEGRPELEEPRRRLFDMILNTPSIDWQLLTKRPENIVRMLPRPGWVQENVWFGVLAENQETANERIPLLLKIPSAVRFLSCEPLLGPIDLNRIPIVIDGYKGYDDPLRKEVWAEGAETAEKYSGHGIDWVFVGGESGPKARAMHPAWVRSIRDQCVSAGVPFFFKQGSKTMEWPDFKNFDSFPQDLKIREFPNATVTDSGHAALDNAALPTATPRGMPAPPHRGNA